MSLWMVIVLLALLKLPIAALMLWIPFRNDQAMNMAAPVDADESGASDDDDGGSKTLPASRWIPTRARPDRTHVAGDLTDPIPSAPPPRGCAHPLSPSPSGAPGRGRGRSRPDLPARL